MFLSFKASSVTLRPSLFGIWNILLQYLISHSYIIAKIGYFNNKAFTLVLRGRSNKINHWFLLVIREFYSKDIITWPTYSYRVVPSRHILGKRSKSARIFTNSSLSDWPWIIMSTMYRSTLMYMIPKRTNVDITFWKCATAPLKHKGTHNHHSNTPKNNVNAVYWREISCMGIW